MCQNVGYGGGGGGGGGRRGGGLLSRAGRAIRGAARRVFGR